jgi:hypothetical protein
MKKALDVVRRMIIEINITKQRKIKFEWLQLSRKTNGHTRNHVRHTAEKYFRNERGSIVKPILMTFKR